jgi:xylan 1,4-beta-xylosidase
MFPIRITRRLLGLIVPLGLLQMAFAADYTLTADASKSIGPFPRFWQEAIGSCHIYMTLNSAQKLNFKDHFALGATELGMKRVRAHGILNDDVGIYKEVNGTPVYNWTRLDSIFDYLVSIKMEPVVEMSFMPKALASGTATFGWYGGAPGNITPPKDWNKWSELCHQMVKHVVERYGAAEVEKWYWEIWNEPDLTIFWTGSQQDYFKLYDYAVEGMLKANPNIKVGGPSVAISGGPWIEAFIEHCMTANLANTAKKSVKLDFISWHTYPSQSGLASINGAHNTVAQRIAAKKTKYPQLNVKNFLTEWNSSYKGGHSYNNEIGSSFVAKVVHSMFPDQNNGIAPPDVGSYWVISDIWEEWDVTSGTAFGPMGLILRRNNVRKPAYLSFQMMARMADTLIDLKGGTKADAGLNGWATIDKAKRRMQVLIYDHNRGDGDNNVATTLDKGKLTIANIPAEFGKVTVARFGVDRTHNNAFRAWEQIGSPANPSDAQWTELAKTGKLNPYTEGFTSAQNGTSLSLNFDQYQPGVSLFEISGEPPSVGTVPGTGARSPGLPELRVYAAGAEMLFTGIPAGADRIEILDSRGRLVRALAASGAPEGEAGKGISGVTVRWDRLDGSGRGIRPGLYIAKAAKGGDLLGARPFLAASLAD